MTGKKKRERRVTGIFEREMAGIFKRERLEFLRDGESLVREVFIFKRGYMCHLNKNSKSKSHLPMYFIIKKINTCRTFSGIARSHMTLLRKPLIFCFIWEKPQLFGFI